MNLACFSGPIALQFRESHEGLDTGDDIGNHGQLLVIEMRETRGGVPRNMVASTFWAQLPLPLTTTLRAPPGKGPDPGQRTPAPS